MNNSGARAGAVLTVTANPAIDRVVEAPGFEAGDHVRVRVRHSTPAGKGINVARGIRLLGERVEASALVGRGEEPQFSRLLESDDIPAHLVLVDGHTRINTTILDTEQHRATHLREEGFHPSGDDIANLRRRILDIVSRLRQPDSPPYVAFCGSLPPGFSTDAFLSILQDVADAGGRVVLDTGGEVLTEARESGAVHVVTPNLLELGQCLGHDVSPEEAPEAARDLLNNVERVLLTLGSEGAYHIGSRGITGGRCPVPPGEVKNTVGAGDAFLSGWLAARCRGCGAEEALKWAVAAGSAAATAEKTVGHSAEMVEDMMRRYERL